MPSSLTERALTFLETLIAFDTTSRNSNMALIDYIQDYFTQEGVPSVRIYNEDKRKANLLATIGQHIAGGIVLSGHTDVVPVDDQEWSTQPFTLTRKGDRLYGRGTADMKAFLAVMLAMTPSFVQAGLAKPIHLAFSYDEEIGCLGVHSLIAHITEQGLNPKLAIIGEPTLMELVNAHKGIYSFKTTVIGHEAHSSAVDKGVNAVMVAAEMVHFLNVLQEEYQQKPRSSEAIRFDPPYTSFHVGVIEGGVARNIIPKHCMFKWEFRLLPGDDATEIIARIDEKTAHVRHKMQHVSPDADIITEQTSHAPDLHPMRTEAETLLLHVSHHNNCKAVSFATEAGIFQKNHIPALICGPGSILQAHKPNEYITVEQIEACVAFMERLIEDLRG